MLLRSRLFLTFVYLGLTLLCAASPAAADQGSSNAGTVSLDQPAYTAHENQGYLTITIQRTGDLSKEEHVGYGVKRQDAQPGIDFQPIDNTYVTFSPGQSSFSFQVPIIDQGMNAPPVRALAYLYGSWPQALGANTNSYVTILHDDPLQPRDAANPLGVPGPVNGNLLAGAKLFVDPDSPAAQAQRADRQSNPGRAGLLGVIANEPGAHRFYMWNMGSNVAGQVSHYLEATQLAQPGTTVMLSTYSLVHDGCGSTATPAIQARYQDFISQVAAGIGNYHAIMFLELDSSITSGCLDSGQLAIREAELRYAVSVLEADPHVLVYLDGGAADALQASDTARFLRDSGVALAQGFFLNSTHYDWMTTELAYGNKISRRLGGGTHFIINSGGNGKGPLRPANRATQGNEVLCNPPGRGLGPLTVAQSVAQQTGYANADGFLWFDSPGNSGGFCGAGAPSTAVFWPDYAAMLVRNWVDRVTGPSSSPATAPTHRSRHHRSRHHRSRHHRSPHQSNARSSSAQSPGNRQGPKRKHHRHHKRKHHRHHKRKHQHRR